MLHTTKLNAKFWISLWLTKYIFLKRLTMLSFNCMYKNLNPCKTKWLESCTCLRSQLAVRLFCPCVFVLEAMFTAFFLKTWIGRGKGREKAQHIHGCARCKYNVQTPRVGVRGYVCHTLRREKVQDTCWQRTNNVRSPCDYHVNV